MIITLNVNELNAPTKKYRLTEWMKTCACMLFHLPPESVGHSIRNCMQLFHIAQLIMFPLWLAIVIIFYLFFCLATNCENINIFYYHDYATITHSVSLCHDWSAEK